MLTYSTPWHECVQLDAGKRPSIEELFKLPRMQEQAELAVKAAQAVPAPYMVGSC
jgi:hypothetical protein